MAPIPGGAYILIGIAMSVFSFFVARTPKANLKGFWIFVGVGVIFIIIGIAKLLLKKAAEPKKPLRSSQMMEQMRQQAAQSQQRGIHQQNPSTRTTQPDNYQQSPQYYQQYQSLSQENPRQAHAHMNHSNQGTEFSQGQHHVRKATHSQESRQHMSIIACPTCGTRHYDYAYFCMRCGTRIQ
jgi:DNA-directed RNA polymerase subunit RPC12/RpoP